MSVKEKLNLDTPGANMFGCAPCPKCGSEFRAPYREDAPNVEDRGKIVCDDCGYRVEYEL